MKVRGMKFLVLLLFLFNFIAVGSVSADDGAESEVGITFEGFEPKPPIDPTPTPIPEPTPQPIKPPAGKLPQTGESQSKQEISLGVFLLGGAILLMTKKKLKAKNE
ncbi:LPXTG cell wall anchor domain-containing protein [Carnobacterium gallinarum]|uniref:LPXTG cell wall anchor domain-containing protein n=1 Tax=Carnobacterium gallinarum TaxID=2749 RepID=UPI000558C1D7|nr:LPXTG cell wall anchor domain-containing protein [Carnobacterium gallinarum]